MTQRPYCEGMRDHLVRCGEAAVEALGLDSDNTSPDEVRQAITVLQSTVRLARMLMQPGPDGPQLEGHRSFREALQRACREDLKTPDVESLNNCLQWNEEDRTLEIRQPDNITLQVTTQENIALAMKAIDEGRTTPIQEIIDDLEGK